MRVLLVGMTHADNPFTRALEKYEGIEVEMIANDSGDRVNHVGHVDAAIFANAVIDHGKFWKVKDIIRARNVPQFHSATGFSPIKEAFENWLQSKGHAVVIKGNGLPAPKTALADAFNKANEPLKPAKDETAYMISKPYNQVEVKRLIIEAANNEMSAIDTVNLLKAEGYTKSSTGQEWEVNRIHSMKYQYKKQGLIRADAATVRSNLKKSGESEPRAIKAPRRARGAELTALEQMELIGKVMTAKGLLPERKMELVEEIHAGMITSENSVMTVKSEGHLQLIMRNIFLAEDTPLVYLDKISAIAIMQSLDKIQELADE